MANTRSAQKRNRQSLKRRARNLSIRNAVKTAVKKAREAVRSNAPNAKDAVNNAKRILDRAATRGVLHAKNASRRVSRLASSLTATAKK
ncbi:MAG: 30S ribosomal protein S20 [Archangiaceae bacterium]|nr:30S ribosomal protein S20 [Archangiaceae bacterium]